MFERLFVLLCLLACLLTGQGQGQRVYRVHSDQAVVAHACHGHR